MTTAPSAVDLPFLDGDAVLRGPLTLEISMEPITSGAPFAYEEVVSDTPDGFFAVWACDAGVYPRVKDRRGSFMYLTEGAGSIIDADGTTHVLGPGSILVLPYAWAGHWDIAETIRKVYVHTTPVPPLPTSPPPCTFVPAEMVLGTLPEGGLVAFNGPDGMCRVDVVPVGEHRYEADGLARFLHLVEGRATVSSDLGGVRELGPGSVVALPSGCSGSLRVTEQLRLVSVLSTPASSS